MADFNKYNHMLMLKQAVNSIVECNEFTKNNGLTLTEQDAVQLVQMRTEALRSNGRIEFGGGTVNRIISYFFDSPYLNQENYAGTIAELLEIFYYYKNELLDLLTDDELLTIMRDLFNGSAQGSLALLGGRDLYAAAEDLRKGRIKKEQLTSVADEINDSAAEDYREAYWEEFENE